MRLPYSISSLALAAAEATLADDTAWQSTIAASRQARVRLAAVLDEHGVRYGSTGGNFLLMNLGDSVDTVTLPRPRDARSPSTATHGRDRDFGSVHQHIAVRMPVRQAHHISRCANRRVWGRTADPAGAAPSACPGWGTRKTGRAGRVR